MNIYQKYKDLSMLNKFAFWGSLASIVGLFYALATTADTTTQNINGNQNTIVGENHGDININYEAPVSSKPSSGKLILNNKSTGSSLVTSEPSIDAATDVSKKVCLAISGTPVEITGKNSSQGYLQFVEIRILGGECKGKIGWVAHQNLTYK